jgi:glycosyltransferase involved in cell wall biosynthesis
MSQEKTTVDFIGKVGEQSGIGNYATKLYHELDKIEDLKINKKEPNWDFPIFHRIDVINRKLQNFLEIPYKTLRSNADITYITSQRKASGLIFLPKRSLKNVVATVHDIEPYVNNAMGLPTQLIAEFYARSIKKLDKIIAISQSTSQELQEHLGIDQDRIKVIYQGVDQDYFQPEEKEKKLEKYGIEKPYLVYVGSEIPRKNMKGTMREFSKLKEENPELTLVKVGTAGDNYRKKTLEYIEENNLEKGEDVIFTGFVDEEDLPQVYSSAEATLLLSTHEGLGRLLLESLACGTPVLANDIDPMNEILPEDMLVNLEEDEMIQKYSERSKDTERNRGLIKEYTWEKTARETAELFKSID